MSVVDKTSTTIDTLPVEPSASIAVEPPHPVKQEPVQDKQEQEPLNGKSQHTTEDGVLAVEQVVNIIDETSERKTAEEESKKKNLDLVKVPLVPFTKRETAIMRLNNRIKILEQNVSLSSRYCSELSFWTDRSGYWGRKIRVYPVCHFFLCVRLLYILHFGRGTLFNC